MCLEHYLEFYFYYLKKNNFNSDQVDNLCHCKLNYTWNIPRKTTKQYDQKRFHIAIERT